MPQAPISVVIPAYNAEAFLEEAIRSVHAQTLQPAEIIVIADDCTDRTPQIAAELGAIVLEQKRRNMAAGLNLGVRATAQPWIALLDADDIWDKRKLALQWQAIKNCPDAALISCDLSILVGKKITPFFRRRYLRERWNDLKNVTINDYCHYLEKVHGDFLPRFNMQTTTVMLRHDVFSSVGFFDEDLIFGQTLELFARVVARYPMAYVERPLVYHRRHDQNHTRNPEAFWPMYISIINRMLKNPHLYPKGAGKAYRESLKEQFRHFERAIARGQFKIYDRTDIKSAEVTSLTEE
jgi:Glycosyltransferases involved in cell wall biogenesis